MAAVDSVQTSSYIIRETTFESTPRPASYGQSVIINRTITTPKTQRMTIEKSTRQVGAGQVQPIEAGQYVSMTTTGVNNVKDVREKERKDMQDLNSRFANYLERVRLLEGRNRGLADELEKLKTKWGRETAQIKAMYQAELDEARKNLDDALAEKAKLEIRSTTLEEELEFVSMEYSLHLELIASNEEKFKFQLERISDYERQIQQLRKTIQDLENEKQRNRELILKLEEALANTRKSLDEETLEHITEENRCQTIKEEIEFLKRVHEQEMNELRGLIHGGSAAENRDYWKAEMQQAIREIQQMYEDKMTTMRTDMEMRYTTKLNQEKERAQKEKTTNAKVIEESTQMKTDLTDLRDTLAKLAEQGDQLQRELNSLRSQKAQRENDLHSRNFELQTEAVTIRKDLESVLRQLGIVMDTKLTLELEIAAYRKLLEGEENRINSKYDLSKMDLSLLNAEKKSDSEELSSSSTGELRAKTTFQTTAKGALAISECSPDGSRVTVENKGKKAKSLVGWKINRTVDGRTLEEEFVFNDRYGRVDPGQKIHIWAHGKRPRHASPLDTETTMETWGVGLKVITKLSNAEGEERATHNQQTVYTR